MDVGSGATIKFKHVADADSGVPKPERQTPGSSGYDIRANLRPRLRSIGITIVPREYALVPTGLIFEIPIGFEIIIRPRSGMAYKHGVTVLNAPGTIDADYRGEIGVLLINHGIAPFTVDHGSRIAQIFLQRNLEIDFIHADRLGVTSRGDGGFGSSGSG